MKPARADAILAGHVLLACSAAFWPALERTPWLGSGAGRGLAGSFAGEILVTASLLAGVAALAGVAVGTLRERRADLLVLAALLAASLAWRAELDVFDLAYLLAVPLALVLRLAERAGAGPRAAGAPGRLDPR